MSALITLQEYADKILSDQYRQTLKSLSDALYLNGWHHGNPRCCGQEVEVRSFLSEAYYAECTACKRFMADVSGPSFGNGHVRLLDESKINMDTKKRWIVGRAPS